MRTPTTRMDDLLFWGLVVLLAQLQQRASSLSPFLIRHRATRGTNRALMATASVSASSFGRNDNKIRKSSKGKLLVLGGTGFLGQEICKQALLQGYEVTSLSRRGLPPPPPPPPVNPTQNEYDKELLMQRVDYRQGDARQMESLTNILNQGGDYTGIIHCIGLLFDETSGLGNLNRFVSGSGSVPDSMSTYEEITQRTAFNAIDAALEYKRRALLQRQSQPLPFCFTSAAEAGWPNVAGGRWIERLSPNFLKRYLAAKRQVEAKLLSETSSSLLLLRPIIVRPSLIYSMDRPASFVPVGIFAACNALGIPFVDRPVTVQNLAKAIVSSMDPNSTVSGIQRYREIDQLANDSS